MSAPLPSSLIVTRFLTILLIMSSLQITTSSPKYLIRHGFDTKRARGIRAVRRDVNAVGSDGRGSVWEDHGSSGPGTKMKCEESSKGNDSSSSVNALNPANVQ